MSNMRQEALPLPVYYDGTSGVWVRREGWPPGFEEAERAPEPEASINPMCCFDPFAWQQERVSERFARAAEAENAEYRGRVEAEEAPRWVPVEDWPAPPSFIPGELLNIYHAAMLHQDRCTELPTARSDNDIEHWIGKPYESELQPRYSVAPEEPETEFERCLRICWEVSQELIAATESSDIPTFNKLPPQNPYQRMIRLDDYLTYARRRGDHGENVAKLLAERKLQTGSETASTPAVTNEPAATSARQANSEAIPAEGGVSATVDNQSVTADIVERIAEWIFSQRPRLGQHQTKLLDAAGRASELGTGFTKANFLAAYQRVYETKPHRPPITGWPLREPYKSRAEEEAKHTK